MNGYYEMKGYAMIQRNYRMDYNPSVHISDWQLVQRLGDAALIGKWFVFLKAEWLQRSGMDRVLATSGILEATPKPAILFRGKEEISLPGATVSPTALPRPDLISLTCDKALYRANRDTVRLLIAAPQHPNEDFRLQLRLSGNPYADYPITLDAYGLCLWSMQELPEGEYEATLNGGAQFIAPAQGDQIVVPNPVNTPGSQFLPPTCRFEVAEYRLAPLNAELADQQLNGETLRYTLSVTAFGKPYSGHIEVELQERGQRVGKRETINCNREGQCRGVVKLTGAGPYTLNIFAGERTATVVLKGSEQERRESLVISELGEIRVLSLLPLPQSNSCRGMYIARGGANTEPFLVRRVVSHEVEIIPRVEAEMLRVVVVDPARGTSEETLFEQLTAEKGISLPVPAPYGIVLLGALIDGKAWEGWCTVLCPPDLHLECEAPKQAKPGSRITITLKSGSAGSEVPVQLIVKDQRVVAPSDPQVELAARIKQNLSTWSEQSGTGEIEQQLAQFGQPPFQYAPGARMRPMAVPFAVPAMMAADGGQVPFATAPQTPTASSVPIPAPQSYAQAGVASRAESTSPATIRAPQATTVTQSMPALAKMRLQFPEVVYNSIVRVNGETSVEVKLGDSMTRYSIEAFALASETLDWERVETTVDAVQPVFGELTVSPFVFPGDPVMGRLDVGAASGAAMVEVRHDGDVLPLFFDDGNEVTPGLPIPSGSVVRFPVRPGAITASVRDARKGGIDVSERYVTEPGKLRHIMRRLKLLTPGDGVTIEELRALEIKPMPGLERPFQFFIEGAAKYPFG